MTDFPLTPGEAIVLATFLEEHAKLPHLVALAGRLRMWARVELAQIDEEQGPYEPAGGVSDPDHPRDANAPSDIGPNVIQADVTHNPWIIACDGGVSSTPDMSAQSRKIWRETAALLARGYNAGPIILDETQDWPSGVGGSQCEGCGQTTIVRGFGDDMLGEPTVYLCKPCATGSTDDDEVQP
ncbi:MAG TPA: hypothetical protein VIK31_03220 [Propionibacteriaceae bacterium]